MHPETLDRLQTAVADRYRVERPIGQGGSATVFLAQDLKLGRPVAIKVLHPEISEAVGAERFSQEIRLTARLQHPHVVAVIDSGSANGLLFYTLPYIPGETLRDRLRHAHRMDLAEAVRFTCELADALEYAHRQGVVHRDVKPENVLISEGHAMITDFGIAKAMTVAGGERLTESGIAVGTPWYMSPEQAAGMDQLDGRSDEYALACVFYEMVTGQPPFSGDVPGAVAAQHLRQPPPSLRDARSGVSRAMSAAVDRALAKSPGERFPSAADFAEALDRSVAGAPPRRLRVRVARRTGLAALVALVAWLGWQKVRAGRGPSLDPSHIALMALTAPGGTPEARAFAANLTNRLTDGLGVIDGLSVVSRRAVAPYEGTDISLDSVARALKVGTLVAGAVESDGQVTRVSLQLIDGATGHQLASTHVQAVSRERYLLVDATADTVTRLLRQALGNSIEKRQRLLETTSQEAFELVQAADGRLDQFYDQLSDTSVRAIHRSLGDADSLLARSERMDPEWVEPVIQRGQLADIRLMQASAEGLPIGPILASGIAHAEQALRMAPANPRALQLHGTLLYRRWSLGPPADSAARAALRDSAEADLQRAIDGNADRASALRILSELATAGGRPEEGMALAQRAYSLDPYFERAYITVFRLFEYNLGAERDSAAAYWCREGTTRFASEPMFYDCQLQLMAWTNTVRPDPARARQLKAKAESLYPLAGRTAFAPRAELMVGIVDARAGRSDSARAILARRMGAGAPNASTVVPEANILELLGERDAGVALLVAFARQNPARRSAVLRSAGLRTLRRDPRVMAAYGLTR